MIRDFDFPEDIDSKNRLSLLSYMISKGIIEFKFAIMKDLKNYPDSMFHAKMGIMRNESEIIAFTGSMNETKNGLGDRT